MRPCFFRPFIYRPKCSRLLTIQLYEPRGFSTELLFSSFSPFSPSIQSTWPKSNQPSRATSHRRSYLARRYIGSNLRLRPALMAACLCPCLAWTKSFFLYATFVKYMLKPTDLEHMCRSTAYGCTQACYLSRASNKPFPSSSRRTRTRQVVSPKAREANGRYVLIVYLINENYAHIVSSSC